jgi:tetratricopeptide (TPR) repeat protein
MMEEILNHLVRIQDLMVTSRTSAMRFKGSKKSIQEIGKELGVATILEGSVRKQGNKVRISVQLIDVNTDHHLWSESYDRHLDDIFTIQSEVAQQVAASLKAEVQPEIKLRIESQPTYSTEAYDLYLEASYNNRTSEEDIQKSVKLLEMAIQIDPEFADAYLGLGFAKSWFGFVMNSLVAGPQEAYKTALPYYQKALEIDPYNSVAHGSLADIILWYKWDFEEAEREYMRTLKLNPNSEYPIDFYIAMGKFNKAVDISSKAIKVDPLNGSAWRKHLLSLYFNNQPDKALTIMKDSPLKDSNGVLMESQRVYVYLNMYDSAIETGNKLLVSSRNSRFLGNQAIAYYHRGEIEMYHDLIVELKQQSKKSSLGSPSFYLAMVYAQMGEIDTAFEWLDKSFYDHEVEMYWLMVEPPFEPLHSDPRWQVMLDKVGFPD